MRESIPLGGTISCHRIPVAVFCSILTVLSFLAPIRAPDWEQAHAMAQGAGRIGTSIAKMRIAAHDPGLIGVVLVGLMAMYYFRWLFEEGGRIKRPSISSAAVSLMFAVCMIVGKSVQTFDSLDFLLANRFQLMYCLLLLPGYWIFFCVFLRSFFSWAGSVMRDRPAAPPGKGFTAFLVDRRPFLIPFGFLLLCWMPYWLIHWPGSVPCDGMMQLNCYFGVTPWYDHHPIFGSLVFGRLMQLGRLLSGDSMGVFFCSLFHHLLFAAVCGFSVLMMKRWGLPKWLRVGSLLFLALNPVIAYWPQTLLKDTTSAALLLLFCTLYLEVIRRIDKKLAVTWVLALSVLAGVVCALFRHSNVYLTALPLTLLVLLKQPAGKRISCALAGIFCLVCTSLVSHFLMDTLEAIPGSTREMLSIPFQQTARYVRDHGDEVTAEEREAIDAVLVFDDLAKKYDSDISDAVKSGYRKDDRALPRYFKTWLSMFQKHPVTYLEAMLSQSYSYYYPDGESTARGDREVVYNIIYDHPLINVGFFDFHFSCEDPTIRQALFNIFYSLKNLPGPNALFHLGVYTWLTLVLMLWLFQQGKAIFALGMTPSILNLFTCILSPVNGHLRYFLPSVLMIPILLGWSFYVIHDHSPKKRNGS